VPLCPHPLPEPLDRPPVQMSAVIHDIDPVGVRGDPSSTMVRAVEFDSRRAGPGSLFCCVPGRHTDGHQHAGEAVSAGASSLLCERFLDLDVTQVCVAPGTVRPAMALVAAAFFGHPSRHLTMVGVTGTNGKTTVTHMVRAILGRAGLSTGVIGTLDGTRTTPEAPVLQGLLAGLRAEGRRAAAMEVSSHALVAHRVDGIVFDVAAFTNLSREHLDHHGSMEEYFAAKAALFDPSRARRAVVFVDDRWGRRLAERWPGELVPVRRSDARHVELSVGSSTFEWFGRRVTVPLSGAFNVDNALVAAAVAGTLGVSPDQVVEGLGALPPVPGRMEVVAAAPFSVLVDYAHTPAGLEAALASARALAGPNRVLCLFGCGGDRDRGKRPDMGSVAARGADMVVLTSDNPRSEDPMAIIDDIRSGITPPADADGLVVEPDRAAAIRTAVRLARPGDVVLVAGKGHETTQVLGDEPLPFDDRVEAARAVAEQGGTAR
jgi:UDP-N-acetylmuramoyl-L-alanyl-D-glutamate--2,6-diaminopimelate ligase